MIDRKTVEYIANLARLDVSDQEKESLMRELDAILEYVGQLDPADTEDVEPTCYVVPQHDPLRSDESRGSLDARDALRNGPSVKYGFFAVPKVIG